MAEKIDTESSYGLSDRQFYWVVGLGMPAAVLAWVALLVASVHP